MSEPKEIRVFVDLEEVNKHIDDLFEKLSEQLAPSRRTEKLLYSAEEAAEALGVTVPKINMWREHGLLPWIKTGTKYSYPVEGLNHFVSEYQSFRVGSPNDCKIALITKANEKRAALPRK